MKPAVHFNERLTVRVISNAQDLTERERKQMWFTDDELYRQRRRAYKLAEELDFYSEEELFDRFGVRSVKTLEKRMERVEKTTFYVKQLEEEGKIFRSSSIRLDNPDGSIHSMDIISALYCHVSKEAADMARDRALRLEKEVHLRSQLKRRSGCINLRNKGN
ncbi:MAG: hypothetical protein SGARI_005054, partial [Bacillariaceae sp.]